MRKKTSALLLAVPAAALMLSGCVGSSTYGTGKSQEEQLYDDVLGLVAMGAGGEKKEQINYLSRPKLVKAPNASQLPAPAENVASQSGYFPQNPEARRQQLLNDISEADANGGDLPAEVVAARAESAQRAKQERRPLASDPLWMQAARDNPQLTKQQREEFLKARAARRGAIGAAPRKYLTEPPSNYRTPEQTAAVGAVGEKEKDPYRYKKKKNILDGIFGKK